MIEETIENPLNPELSEPKELFPVKSISLWEDLKALGITEFYGIKIEAISFRYTFVYLSVEDLYFIIDTKMERIAMSAPASSLKVFNSHRVKELMVAGTTCDLICYDSIGSLLSIIGRGSKVRFQKNVFRKFQKEDFVLKVLPETNKLIYIVTEEFYMRVMTLDLKSKKILREAVHSIQDLSLKKNTPSKYDYLLRLQLLSSTKTCMYLALKIIMDYRYIGTTVIEYDIVRGSLTELYTFNNNNETILTPLSDNIHKEPINTSSTNPSPSPNTTPTPPSAYCLSSLCYSLPRQRPSLPAFLPFTSPGEGGRETTNTK